MDAIIAPLYYSGLRHAGGEHYSSLPDSATSTPATPRLKFSKILSGFNDCLMQEHRLYVAKALGHPKPAPDTMLARFNLLEKQLHNALVMPPLLTEELCAGHVPHVKVREI